MAEQFTITGVVQPGNAPRVGMKVQAFDRDMPSVERRGSAPGPARSSSPRCQRPRHDENGARAPG